MEEKIDLNISVRRSKRITMGCNKRLNLKSLYSIVFIVMSLLATSSVAMAGEKITGIYSSLSYHEESGDLNGAEVFIARTSSGYQGTIQIAEGGAGQLSLIDISMNRDAVLFSIPSGIYAGKFVGIIKNKILKGTLKLNNGGEVSFRLPKKCSYWQ